MIRIRRVAAVAALTNRPHHHLETRTRIDIAIRTSILPVVRVATKTRIVAIKIRIVAAIRKRIVAIKTRNVATKTRFAAIKTRIVVIKTRVATRIGIVNVTRTSPGTRIRNAAKIIKAGWF